MVAQVEQFTTTDPVVMCNEINRRLAIGKKVVGTWYGWEWRTWRWVRVFIAEFTDSPPASEQKTRLEFRWGPVSERPIPGPVISE